MKILYASLYVDDQEKALDFYTEKLGFTKKEDVSQGGYRWLTVADPENSTGTALLLEANAGPLSQAYTKGLMESGIPATMLGVEDLNAEYTRLKDLGVEFTMEPQDIGPKVIAQILDGCGNIIQLNQPV